MIVDLAGLRQALRNCMTQRILLALVCGWFGFAVSGATEGAAPKRPNVLYVIADMERAFSMGCYGDANARTPTLDKFAAQGLRMDACISTTPVCCPYRASLMSGQLAHHNGMLSNGCEFKPTVKCLGETFKAAGYEMGYLGKWHLGRANKKSDPTYGFPPPTTEYGIYEFERDPAPTTGS